VGASYHTCWHFVETAQDDLINDGQKEASPAESFAETHIKTSKRLVETDIAHGTRLLQAQQGSYPVEIS
jgi:hypothetical protein